MLPLHLLDDDTVEALLAGRPVTPGLAPLAGAVGAIRSAAQHPARPSALLAQRMASGDFSGIRPAAVPSRPAGRRLRTWLAGVSPRARVVTGALVVVTGLTAATAADALPGGTQARMESFLETVSPISFQGDEPQPESVDVEDLRDSQPDRDDAATSTPDDPGSSVFPPGKPEQPPGRPDAPGKPDQPPGKPDQPPGKPDQPPGKPDSPGKPDQPPGKPDSPPGRPDDPGNDGATGPDR